MIDGAEMAAHAGRYSRLFDHPSEQSKDHCVGFPSLDCATSTLNSIWWRKW